jgi:bacteriocin-like protein
MEKIIMTNEEKVEKIKALIGEIGELSKELSEDELKQVAGGITVPPGSAAGPAVPSGIMRQVYNARGGEGEYPSEPFDGTIHRF